MTVFHITTAQRWKAALEAGEYRPPSLETERFIHFSRADQLLGSANRFFATETNVVVLQVNTSKLIAPLRDEPADGMVFPHLYGPLNIDAVENVLPLPRKLDGSFVHPAAWAEDSSPER